MTLGCLAWMTYGQFRRRRVDPRATVHLIPLAHVGRFRLLLSREER